jgi:hypothetical protein
MRRLARVVLPPPSLGRPVVSTTKQLPPVCGGSRRLIHTDQQPFTPGITSSCSWGDALAQLRDEFKQRCHPNLRSCLRTGPSDPNVIPLVFLCLLWDRLHNLKRSLSKINIRMTSLLFTMLISHQVSKKVFQELQDREESFEDVCRAFETRLQDPSSVHSHLLPHHHPPLYSLFEVVWRPDTCNL